MSIFQIKFLFLPSSLIDAQDPSLSDTINEKNRNKQDARMLHIPISDESPTKELSYFSCSKD
jgi:protein-tyrosine phosphatase